MADAAFPAHWEADVILRDGRPCHVRPIEPSDAARLRAFHGSLSAQTIYYRYFAPYPELTDADVTRFTTVDYVDRVALVATMGPDIIGVGRYDRVTPDEAEVAFTIRDDHQGRGLGSVLLEHLAAAARERGVQRFVADVLPENRRMQATFEEAGFRPRREREDGYLRLEFAIEPTAQLIQVMEARERAADARSIRRLLTPSAVAVVGASRTPGTAGHELLRNLRDAGFTGTVFAVHPEAERILDFPCIRSVSQAPVAVDLAVIVVRAESVLDIVDDCAAAGVQGLVVVSTGFAEAGPEGRVRQRELVARARGNGMRVVGPAALGLVNTDPHVRLNASLASSIPGRGRLGFFCQSGGLGSVILADLVERGLGLSTFVSAGNRSDVSGNDLLQYWTEDDSTDAVLLYLESVGNPRKFTRIVGRLARTKPVVAVRSGRSSQAIPLGHRVRATSLPSAAVDALFDQCGVIQTDSVRQLLDVAAVVALQPLPTSSLVSVISTAEALGVLAEDSARSVGLRIATTEVLPLPLATDELVAAVLRAEVDPQVGSVLIVHVPPLPGDVDRFREALTAVAPRLTTPVIAVSVASAGEPLPHAPGAPERFGPWIGDTEEDGLSAPGAVPLFTTVEEATAALAAVMRHARWRAQDPGKLPEISDEAHREAERACSELRGAHTAPVTVSGDPVLHLMGLFGAPDRVAASAPNSGVICRIELIDDELFGPVVAFGLTGPIPELLGDRAYAAPPLTDSDARALIAAPATASLLVDAGIDRDALANTVWALSAMSDALPDVVAAEVVVVAHADGVDVRVATLTVGSESPATDEARRMM